MNNSVENPPIFPGALLRMGWNSYFEALRGRLETDTLLARVTGTRKYSFLVSDGEKEWPATVSKSITHHSGLHPVPGDWVLLRGTVISEVLPRKNALSRGAAGARGRKEEIAAEQQVIAANIDRVFIVCGLDRDFSLRRIERYLTLVYNCGLDPAIILTKADLHPDPERFEREVATVAFGVPVHLVSALDGAGLAAIEEHLSPGQTVTMIGSSGAGKSTLLNRLFGTDLQMTGPVSEVDGKGMHTTTTRDLISMPQGGMLIDNPGIREIAFWDTGDGIEAAFPEINALAADCRFSDCTHLHEPGCRIQAALADGTLDPDRLESYRKIKREMGYLSDRQQKSADRVEKEHWKKISLTVKAMKKSGKL